MITSRRNFIKSSALLGTGILLNPFSSIPTPKKAGKLFREIGVCTSFSNYSIIEAAGYAYIEESVQSFLVPLEAEPAFIDKLALMKKSRLPIPAMNNFIPGKLKSVGPDAVHDDILKYVETALRRARTVGVKYIVFGSGGSRKIPDGFSAETAREQFISLCKKIAPIAEKNNVVIVLEPLNRGECNFINSVAEGGEIVKVVNHKNFRLLADIYHMLRENETPENIVKYGNIIRHIHIAENVGREAPGKNTADFIPYFKAIKQINYKGYLSIECNWKNLQEQAAPALSVLKKQIDTF